MKIAVASEGEQVTHHFGHCQNFNIFEVKNNGIMERKSVDNPGHKPGALPVFLSNEGVQVVIAGGVGKRAVELFDEKGIEVITGIRGKADEVVIQYLAGQLESSGEVCEEHQHAGECS